MVKPDELLAHARESLKTSSSEVGHRQVIIEAYYAVYHACEHFEESLPHRSNVPKSAKSGSHDWLIGRLRIPHPQLDYLLRVISQELGEGLNQLKPLREQAQYRLNETVYVDQAEEAVRSATDLLKEAAQGMKTITG